MAEQIDHHDTSGNLPLHLQYIVNGLNKIIEHLKRSPKGNGALSELVGVIEKTCSPQTNNMFLGPPGLKHLRKEVNLKKILKKFEPLLRVTCTKAELKPDKTNTAQEVVEEFFHLAVADVALLVYSGIHDVHDLHSKITSSDSPVFITMGCNFQEFMASLHSQKCFFNIPSDYDIFLGDGEFVENDRVPSLPEPSSECFHSSQAEKHPVDSSKTDIQKAPSFGNDSLASGVDTVDTTPAHGCPSLSLLSNAGKLQTENENVIGDYDTLASRNQSAVGVAEETSTSWHWESRLFSKVNTHQTHQGTTGMRYGGSTECTVTIVKETGYFDKLLMEKLSAYMRPIIGISCSHGWLLVHFWEGESYAIDLCALSPGTKQDLAFAGTKVAGGTPDNIHKWAIIHSMGRVLSENSILKVVFDALDLSRNLEENAGLKVVRVFDIMEADRIIRGHSSVMPLQEVLQVYGIMPYSSVDIVTGSQRVPVSDDLVDYCGKSQRQAISYLRKMAQVFSRMIPFLYQSVLSIMSAPMLTELNQRSNATVQSPQQSDYWYNPRERSRISEPVKLPTHPCAPKVKESQPSSAASNGKKKQQENKLDNRVKPKATNQTASSVVTVTVTNALQMDEQQKQLQGSTQPPSVKKKKKKKKKESIEKQSPPELRSSRSQDLVNPGGAIQKEQNRMPQQKLQNDVKPKKSSVTSASGQVKPQEQTSSTKSPEGAVGKEKNQLKVKVHNDVVLKESRGLEACGPAKTKEDTNQSKSLHSSKEKGKNQMSQLDMQYDVKAKDTTLNVASVPGKAMDVDVKKERSRMPQQKKQNGVKPKNENLTSASVPAQIQERSSSSKSHLNPGAANENKQNQMPQQKMQNDLKPKKSSVTSASVPAKIQEKNSSSKCHLNPDAASKNEQKQMPQPKVQNDKKPPQNSEIGASGLPKTKDQNNSPKSPHIPREVVKKEQNQVSFERLLNDVTSTKSGITSASGPGKSTDHQPKQEKHQKKQQESSKVKDSVKAESKKKMKEYEEPALRTEKEYSKSEVSHHQQQPTPQRDSPAKKQESDANPTSKHQQMQQKNSKVKDSVKVELKKKEFDNPALRTEKEHTKSDISHHQQPTLHRDSPDEEKESDASPTSVSFTEESGKLEKKSCQDQDPIRTNKKDTRKENTLEQLFHVDKDQGVTDFMTSFELGHIPQQQMQQKQNLKQNIPADEVKKRPQNQPYQQSDLASNKGDQYQNIEVTKQHFQDTHLYQELPSLPKKWPQQQEQSQEQQDQQLLSQLIEDQNISGVPNRDVLSGNQNTDASNVQAKDTLVQQQFYQPQNQQQQNTNVQQQYYQTHQQQEQNLPQQPQNTHLQQQMHLQQHQPTQIDQQPQQLTQHAFLQNTHPHKEVLGSPLLQNQHVPVSGHQATGPLWLTPSNPMNTRVMPNLGLPNPGLPNPAPGIIRQIPLGVVIQAPALPGQQGTTFLQWEQPFRRQVKTSPEAKMSTIPQWMKPMVLQFDEDNYPVFIHPLSEQASIPINPCDITDEQDEQFDDLAISDVTTFVEAFPENFQFALQQLSLESCSYSYVHLVELVMDVGRKPKALYLKSGFSSELTEKVLNHSNLTKQDLDDILKDNSFFRTCDSQAMIRDTLHRLGLLTNAHGEVIGMTAKVEHPFPGCLSPLYDVFNKDKSILVVGPTGVGKTTLLREAARVLSDLEEKSVFVIDTLSEIAGEGDIPHQSIGSARRLQVTECNLQHKIMKEAYQNHRPEIVIVDEIRSLEDAKASLNLRLKGIKLIAGVQGLTLTDVLLNTALTPICGGIKESSIVGNQGGKTVRLRTGPAVFDILVEMLERGRWIIHWDFAWAIDALLPGGSRTVGVEERKVVKCKGDDSGLVSQQVLAMQMPASYTIYTQ